MFPTSMPTISWWPTSSSTPTISPFPTFMENENNIYYKVIPESSTITSVPSTSSTISWWPTSSATPTISPFPTYIEDTSFDYYSALPLLPPSLSWWPTPSATPTASPFPTFDEREHIYYATVNKVDPMESKKKGEDKTNSKEKTKDTQNNSLTITKNPVFSSSYVINKATNSIEITNQISLDSILDSHSIILNTKSKDLDLQSNQVEIVPKVEMNTVSTPEAILEKKEQLDPYEINDNSKDANPTRTELRNIDNGSIIQRNFTLDSIIHESIEYYDDYYYYPTVSPFPTASSTPTISPFPTSSSTPTTSPIPTSNSTPTISPVSTVSAAPSTYYYYYEDYTDYYYYALTNHPAPSTTPKPTPFPVSAAPSTYNYYYGDYTDDYYYALNDYKDDYSDYYYVDEYESSHVPSTNQVSAPSSKKTAPPSIDKKSHPEDTKITKVYGGIWIRFCQNYVYSHPLKNTSDTIIEFEFVIGSNISLESYLDTLAENLLDIVAKQILTCQSSVNPPNENHRFIKENENNSIFALAYPSDEKLKKIGQCDGKGQSTVKNCDIIKGKFIVTSATASVKTTELEAKRSIKNVFDENKLVSTNPDIAYCQYVKADAQNDIVVIKSSENENKKTSVIGMAVFGSVVVFMFLSAIFVIHRRRVQFLRISTVEEFQDAEELEFHVEDGKLVPSDMVGKGENQPSLNKQRPSSRTVNSLKYTSVDQDMKDDRPIHSRTRTHLKSSIRSNIIYSPEDVSDTSNELSAHSSWRSTYHDSRELTQLTPKINNHSQERKIRSPPRRSDERWRNRKFSRNRSSDRTTEIYDDDDTTTGTHDNKEYNKGRLSRYHEDYGWRTNHRIPSRRDSRSLSPRKSYKCRQLIREEEEKEHHQRRRCSRSESPNKVNRREENLKYENHEGSLLFSLGLHQDEH